MKDFDICGHGKMFKKRCIECELVSAREGLATAKENMNLYGKLIAKLEAERELFSNGQRPAEKQARNEHEE